MNPRQDEATLELRTQLFQRVRGKRSSVRGQEPAAGHRAARKPRENGGPFDKAAPGAEIHGDASVASRVPASSGSVSLRKDGHVQ